MVALNSIREIEKIMTTTKDSIKTMIEKGHPMTTLLIAITPLTHDLALPTIDTDKIIRAGIRINILIIEIDQGAMTGMDITMTVGNIEMIVMIITMGEDIENMMRGDTEATMKNMIGIIAIGRNTKMIEVITTKKGRKTTGQLMKETLIKKMTDIIVMEKKTDIISRAGIKMNNAIIRMKDIAKMTAI